MTREEFIELLEKYRTGRLEEHTVLEFMRLVKEGEYDEDLKEQIFQVLQNNTADYGWTQADATEVLTRILENKRQGKVVTAKRNRWRLAAAAIIFVICGSSYLLFFRPVQRSSSAVTTVANLSGHDIAPGGNKAVLILADGTQVVLDSAINGTLAQQGGTKVIKVDDGQLAYKGISGRLDVILYNTVRTPKGGQYKLILPDGSRVWLNAGSSLKFPTVFPDSSREVALTGEAYFEIAKNDNAPFLVKVKNTVVKALGTRFDIMAYDDENEMQTTLLEGKVKVSLGTHNEILRPGMQTRIENSSNGFPNNNALNTKIAVADVNPMEFIAWKRGLIRMNNADVPEVMRQIGRWYDVNIEYEGKSFPSWKTVGTIPRTLHLSDVLKVLDINGIHCVLTGRTIVVHL